ncbi:hypothetical protein HPB50_015814 [Hyalomma asiaticum]|uniref:Uncharacterized protein n=1 Tax=Hyalomma asiaticum TaxID=266040 RepID=A0ACB7RWM0_HYAAI|nr:hypothetical protein HPB50_015814 [Hyalomma asiaticum]
MATAERLGFTKEETLRLYEEKNTRQREERALAREQVREGSGRARELEARVMRMAEIGERKMQLEKKLREFKLRLSAAN